MRIIGGKYKGKKLIQPLDKTTRPLKDLVKESIFNIIQHSNKINIQIENSKILDLYAGSGSFGIECISRDAKLVYFFEKHLNAIKILNQNINSLKENSNYELFEKDCLDFFASDSFPVPYAKYEDVPTCLNCEVSWKSFPIMTRQNRGYSELNFWAGFFHSSSHKVMDD